MPAQARKSSMKPIVHRALDLLPALGAALVLGSSAAAQPPIAVATATATSTSSSSSSSTATSPQASTPAPTERALHFDVFLDDRPIGYQRFDLRTQPDGLRVETRARFEVSWLRVKALDYDHRDVEQWRGGCLASISSQTDSNGTPSRVVGEAKGPVFDVTTPKGRQQLDDCVGTFSYWDKRQLQRRSKLLNPQTGEYLTVSMRPLGRGELALGDRSLAVERYVLEGEDLEITLAYSLETGEWVALDSPLFGGFDLRYRRRAAELTELRTKSASESASESETANGASTASFDTP